MRNDEQSPPRGGQQSPPRSAGQSPIVVLSYAYSGARRVQELLAVDTELACTLATGVIPLCEVAAETWRRVEGRSGQDLSRLAVSTIRGIASVQVTVILAGSGKSRWCELATAPPSAMAPFLQVFPHTGIVCIHRSSLDVIRAGVQASPWGLQGQGLLPYLLSHPGNSVAALAAYWAQSTEQLLAFEAEHPAATHVRYEDVAADPVQALTTVRAFLGLHNEVSGRAFPERMDLPAQDTAPRPAELTVPVEMIPGPVRERITRLHTQLGYPRLRDNADNVPGAQQEDQAGYAYAARKELAQPTDLRTGPIETRPWELIAGASGWMRTVSSLRWRSGRLGRLRRPAYSRPRRKGSASSLRA